MTVYSLSIHADYRCRNSGACCSADWDVPVELPVYLNLEAALAAGRFQAAASITELFDTEPELPEGAAAMLGRTAGGDCVFFDRGTRLCVVHRDLGESALPDTCRHFPRLAVRDRRGTFITLSHFCPTAASALFRDDVPLEVVASPAAFPPADYDGLTVHPDAWPPLLHPRMLMDLEGYSAWERHMVRRCGSREAPESIVATLARDAARLRRWRPGDGPLVDAIGALREPPVPAGVPSTLDRSLALYDQVAASAPDDLQPAPDRDGIDAAYAEYVVPAWNDLRRPIGRFLAAKAFASWAAYQGRGVLTLVRGLESALAVARVEAARQCRNAGRRLDADLMLEAFRAADFLLNHLAAADDLARRWSGVERDART